MRSGIWDREAISSRFVMPSPWPIIALVIALICGGVLGTLSSTLCLVAVVAMGMALVIALRQDELALIMIIAVHLYVDWYLGKHIVSLTVALALLLFFYLARSSKRPFAEPRFIWLWFLYLALAIYPAFQGALTAYDAAFYYPNIIFGAFIWAWLGTILARNMTSIGLLFKLFSLFATLLALHTIIQATTGLILFGSSHYDALLLSVANYTEAGSNIPRTGSFFVDPNWNGTFFAMALFISLGLFAYSSSLLAKALYLIEVSLIVIALLFTFSNGAWVGCFAGTIIFVLFVGHNRYRLILPLCLVMLAGILLVFFPSQIAFQLQHASRADELPLRIAGWQTAIQVIKAFPLTGVGLGLQAYGLRSAPYRVPAQIIPLVHPHDSYLELGAMAGLPLLIVFLALLCSFLRSAWRNWKGLDRRDRCLLGGGLATIAALSINSISINGWTLPPLAAMGWLLLGTISSPLLVKGQREAAQDHASKPEKMLC